MSVHASMLVEENDVPVLFRNLHSSLAGFKVFDAERADADQADKAIFRQCIGVLAGVGNRNRLVFHTTYPA